MDEILKKVLAKVTPTEAEQKLEAALVKKLLEKLKTYKVSPVLVGSNAKDTDLSGDKDLDVFIRFPATTSRETLERRGLEIGKDFFKSFKSGYTIDYAEHPYVKGVVEGYDVEVVPCFGGKKILSSVDRTPFHTEYVKGKLKAAPKLKGDIRLLKQFMKAQRVYGAEEKVRGFSGYLVELLTINYGSFKKVLEATAELEFGETLDPEKQWSDAGALKHFFPQAARVVADPVDRDRNVAAAVSREKFAEFAAAARDFLDEPAEAKFFPKEVKAASAQELKKLIKERGTRLLAVTFKHGRLNENSLYSQLRRTAASLAKTVESHDFKVFRTGFWTDEKELSVALAELEVWELPAVMHRVGPPIDLDAMHQERFRDKYASEEPYVKDGRWVVDTKRRVTTIEQLAPQLLKETRGFGKNLKNAKLKVVFDEKIVALDGVEFRKYLTEFL